MQKTAEALKNLLRESIDTTPGQIATFFKTGVGGYAEHDHFIGVRVPTLRKLARSFESLPLDALKLLLTSPINEERFLALIILSHQYKKGSLETKEKIYEFYIQNLNAINNWNLVDASAHLIIGAHLWDKDRRYLMELATSHAMWERRISIVATWYFIKRGDLDWTFKIAALLLKDSHDLIHKSVGWMLREAGVKDLSQLVLFLEIYKSTMPRTMLRYAIEKFPEEQRKSYLIKKPL